jgi:hypothetical protein
VLALITTFSDLVQTLAIPHRDQLRPYAVTKLQELRSQLSLYACKIYRQLCVSCRPQRDLIFRESEFWCRLSSVGLPWRNGVSQRQHLPTFRMKVLMSPKIIILVGLVDLSRRNYVPLKVGRQYTDRWYGVRTLNNKICSRNLCKWCRQRGQSQRNYNQQQQASVWNSEQRYCSNAI